MGDLRACEAAGCTLVFMPSVEDMYPPNAVTRVQVEKLVDTLCGASRPGHFDGVATICAKLFNIVQPDAAYFGQKDAQQLAVLKRMVRDLDMPLEVLGCPTVREADGLAMSSRNAYLSPEQRAQATCLYRGLCLARERIVAGERDCEKITRAVREVIENAGPAQVDYVSVVDPESMQPIGEIVGPVLVALAVHMGPARLIDNMVVDPAGGGA